MSIWSKITGADGAVKGVIEAGKKGMDMWDKSKFTPQEQIEAFKTLVNSMKDAATSISRRHLLWALIAKVALILAYGIYCIETGQAQKIDQLIKFTTALNIHWAFTGAVSFYYLTHLTQGKSQK